MTPGSVRVSIGMPVFNLERTVARAIESVLAQTFTDFELVVSDNASQDGTEQICRRYAERDSRIRYTRQPGAISAADNFRFVLDAARGPYFMWLAADDYVLPRLLERGVALLQGRADVVCAVPQVEFLGADGQRWAGAGSFALLGSPRENLCRFLRDPRDNSRFYGLYRRDAVRRVLPDSACYGFDWIVAAGTLLYGKHAELPEVLLVREASDPLKYMRLVDAVDAGRLARLLPLARFTRALLVDLRVPPHPCVLYTLLRINTIHHILYCRYRYPRYGRLVYRLALRLARLGNMTCGATPG